MPTSTSTSIPSLPDVTRPYKNQQPWTFLHTLLANAQEEEEKGQKHASHKPKQGDPKKDIRQTASADRSPRESQASSSNSDRQAATPLSAITAKTVPEETLSGRRGQRRRHSRDSPPSARRLSTSGPLSSKKKFKHRLSHSYDCKPASSSRFSYPLTATIHSTKPGEAGYDSVHANIDHYPTNRGEADIDTSDPQMTRATALSQPVSTPCTAGGTTTDKVLDSGSLNSDEEKPKPVTENALSVSPSLASRSKDKAMSHTRTENKTTAETSLHDLVSQWTTCRALDDDDDDNDADDDETDDVENDDNEAYLGQSQSQDALTREVSRLADSSLTDGFFSRANSSTNLTRRKRPLLLPPIMLPPIYTVKPTPLKLRDDIDFLGPNPRARQPISDEDWERLRDCRYLRIRTLRRPLKV